MSKKRLTFIPDLDALEQVQAYLDGEMETAGISMRLMNRMDVAIDEIYSNIVHYSHAATSTVAIEITETCIEVELRDNGTPFDPLAKEDPNITLNAEEREIGGLGIFMTKKLMSEVLYQYLDGFNCITIKLNR